MSSIFRFFLMALVSASLVILAAVGWPRITNRPRPAPLVKVNDFLSTTPVGQEVAQVLGVTDDRGTQPINLSNTIASLAANLVTTITTQAQRALTSQLLQQLLKQYEQLPPEQKQQLETLICKPSQ